MLHIILGPPCSGKSTYVSANAKDGDLIVDFDVIASALGAKEKHNSSGIVRTAAFAARAAAVETAISQAENYDSWIIHSSPSDDQMERYEALQADIVRLDPGMEECIRRSQEDNRPDWTEAAIRSFYAAQKGGSMNVRYKSFGIETVSDNGVIEGYASTWDREPDSYGDVVAKGAFARTLEEWKAGGRRIPLLWSHGMTDLKSFIGYAECDEDERGLHFVGHFDDTPEAQRVRELYKDGRLSKFSFAYDIKKCANVLLENGLWANELQDVDLHEVSCVVVPANSHAEVLGVKSDISENAAIAALEKALTALKSAMAESRPTPGKDGRTDNGAPEDLNCCNPKQKAALDKIKSIMEEST